MQEVTCFGVARTLYHDADVLLFDESFTSLDAANRDAFLDRLFGLEGKTLVLSSREQAMASRCDRIVIVEQGRASEQAMTRGVRLR